MLLTSAAMATLATQASAAPVVVYAAASSSGAGNCSSVANACTLSTALSAVVAGGTIELVTPGDSARYVGNWILNTSGTSSAAPVTIMPAPGLSHQPILDGNGPSAPSGQTCSTGSCNGVILAIGPAVYTVISGITIADANSPDDLFEGGGMEVHGSVVISDTTFTDNHGTIGGAIDMNDDLSGPGPGGTVTITRSTFRNNTAVTNGGAITVGPQNNSFALSVSESTFVDNSAGGNGGAIDVAGGSTSVVASTLVGGTGSLSLIGIDSGAVTVAANVFSGICVQNGGTRTDSGFNVGSDASCFSTTPPSSDVNAGSTAALALGALGDHGGPTQTIVPGAGPVVGAIANPTSVTIGANNVALCPTTDQRAYASTANTKCDAGALQTSGVPVAASLALTSGDGQHALTNRYFTNALVVTVTDAHGNPVAGAPVTFTVHGAATFWGTVQVVHRNSAANGTASGPRALAGATPGRVTVSVSTPGAPPTAFHLTVDPQPWTGPAASGYTKVRPHSAVGFYIGLANSEADTWNLQVTQPTAPPRMRFTGTVVANAGAFTNVKGIRLEDSDTFRVSPDASRITFSFSNAAFVDGITFTAPPNATSMTFTLAINGNPATSQQINLGSARAHPANGSPLQVTRHQ